MAEKQRMEFAKTQRDAVLKLKEALQAEANTGVCGHTGGKSAAEGLLFSKARRIAHSLKSTAGLIGETALFDAAGKIEDTIASGGEVSEIDLDALQEELSGVIAGIKIPEGVFPSGSVGGNCSDSGNGTMLDKNAARELFSRLHPLLKTHSSECLSFIPKLAQLPQSAVLVRQIEQFEFSHAIITLKTMEDIFDL